MIIPHIWSEIEDKATHWRQGYSSLDTKNRRQDYLLLDAGNRRQGYLLLEAGNRGKGYSLKEIRRDKQ